MATFTDRFAVTCPSCSSRLRVQAQDLGAERTCPQCGTRFLLPDRKSAQRADRIQRAKSEFSFICRLCGTTLYAEPSAAGSSMACPDCHADNQVPATPPAKLSSGLSPLPFADELKFQDELDPQVNAQFPVKCSVCDGMDYATPAQIGKSILCRDCGSIIVVRPPPPKKKSIVRAVDPKIEIAPAESIPVSESTAATVLERARIEIDRREAEKPIPPKRPLQDGVYSFPFYLDVLPRWILIAIMVCCVWAIFQYGQTCTSGIDMLIAMACGVVMIFGVLATSLMHSALSMAIVESTAMGYDKVHHWPGFDFVDRFTSFIRWNAAIGFATLPATLVSFLIPQQIPFYAWAAPPLAFVGFPFVFLSMLDNDSMAVPYSKTIFGSYKLHRPIWRMFFWQALPLAIVAGGGAWLSIYLKNDYFTYPYWVVAVALSIIYARLIGRLAWSLDQVITLNPDRDNVELDALPRRGQSPIDLPGARSK